MQPSLLKRITVAVGLGLLLACGGNGNDNPAPNAPPNFAIEAKNLGLTLPTDTLAGTSNLSVLDADVLVAGTSGPLWGNTSKGVLSFSANLSPAALALPNVHVESWVNGESQAVLLAGTQASGQLVLNSGNNYVCAIVYSGSTPYGRSQVLKVTSNTPASVARVQLSWSGVGDVDLHVDDGFGGKHVYYASKTYTTGGFNIGLDVDNVTAYGPENIRFYSLPSMNTFRIFVNYYSGSESQACTVRVFDAAGVKKYQYTHTFSPEDSNGGSTYNSQSWNVGTLQISPYGRAESNNEVLFSPPKPAE